jgi:uncharacterized protein YqjF (DUF2071 family)
MPLPGDCDEYICSVDYYRARNDDFRARHQTPDPPRYYLDYGVKYFDRFQALSKTLSATGKAWVKATAQKLQQMMEARVVQDRQTYDQLELDWRKFEEFAYRTHPDAYVQSGLARLPLSDLAEVATTPDAKDILTDQGILQVMRTAIDLAKQYDKSESKAVVRELDRLVAQARTLDRNFNQVFVHDLRQLRDEARQLSSDLSGILKKVLNLAGRLLDDIFKPDWTMRQRWQSPLICSWGLDPAVVEKLVPDKLKLDLKDGKAWVSVVPLRMAKVGFLTSFLPRLATFGQINLRTYVRYQDRPGVYFLSLECGRELVDILAPLLFHLPYERAEVSITEANGSFKCRSQGAHAGKDFQLQCDYRPQEGSALEPATKGSLEAFIAERYSMFVVDDGKVLRGDVKHEPWKLQRAAVDSWVDTLTSAHGLPALGPPHEAYLSPGVDTISRPFVVVS